ncbi:DUF1622 domain-containing protein [Micromonospora sp. NBC_01699]|uniref:DUF1622 domain-containing protein n=1 Tax=Micromonospora sp. NBC_01699 TaxID=2975984 RepID=UPI002E33BE7D|nr:hypothetical protein [Micromonospora sp. NBC_01699]
MAIGVITAAALVSGVVTLLTVRSWRTALRLLLDLLTAASLIRLVSAEHWTDIATAGTIVLLRTVIGSVLATPATGMGPTRAKPGTRPTPPTSAPTQPSG